MLTSMTKNEKCEKLSSFVQMDQNFNHFLLTRERAKFFSAEGYYFQLFECVGLFPRPQKIHL